MDQHKVIIAGVGRSGTSFLFEEVAAALKAKGRARLFYEPYLWAPAKVNQTGAVNQEPFDTRNLSPFGIHVHCATPLFLDQSHPVHDQMIHHLLGHRDHTMTKMIRGNGRLKSYLTADPELRVVGMTRDVLGTVNSAANHFSFFGEEFHPTDRPRFRSEVQARFGARTPVDQPDEASRQALLSAYWWKFMTQALLDAQEAYPDRVCLIDYGSLRAVPDGAYQKIDRFLGLPVSAHRLQQRVGIVSSSNYLESVPLEILAPFHQWSKETFETHDQAFVDPSSPLMADFDPAQGGSGKSASGVVPRYPLFRTAVGWRYALAARDADCAAQAALTAMTFDAFTTSLADKLRTQTAAPALIEGRPKISVIIPVWNGAESIEAAVASVWAQKDVNAEVVLVEDVSSDNTVEVIEAFLQKGQGKLVRNQRNLGPALSRHKGIQAATFPLFTTLDADDLMMPTKLAAEADAIAGDPGAVSFSNVLYRRGNDWKLWTYDQLGGMAKPDLLSQFAARKTTLPRDMMLHRSLYDRTRGFDALLRMYEDWAFKIELAGVASSWRSTGEAGTCYEHKYVGQSAGEPPKHRFWVTASFLRNADALALQFGGQSIDFLRHALSQFGVTDSIDAGLGAMRRRSRFLGNIVEDFDRMRRATHALIPCADLDFETRVDQIYGAFQELPMAAE